MNAPIPSRENLIFGIFAWRLGYIDQDQLSAAMKQCLAEQAKPMSEILVDMEYISDDSRLKLDQLIRDQLQHHQGDEQQSWDSLQCQPEFVTTIAGNVGGTEPIVQRDPPLRQEESGELLPITGHLKLIELHAQGGLGEWQIVGVLPPTLTCRVPSCVGMRLSSPKLGRRSRGQRPATGSGESSSSNGPVLCQTLPCAESSTAGLASTRDGCRRLRPRRPLRR